MHLRLVLPYWLIWTHTSTMTMSAPIRKHTHTSSCIFTVDLYLASLLAFVFGSDMALPSSMCADCRSWYLWYIYIVNDLWYIFVNYLWYIFVNYLWYILCDTYTMWTTCVTYLWTTCDTYTLWTTCDTYNVIHIHCERPVIHIMWYIYIVNDLWYILCETYTLWIVNYLWHIFREREVIKQDFTEYRAVRVPSI